MRLVFRSSVSLSINGAADCSLGDVRPAPHEDDCGLHCRFRNLESSCRSLPRGARHTAKTRTRVALDRSGTPKPLILQDAAVGSIPITRSMPAFARQHTATSS
jgi:hypothetical protein